MSPGGGPTRAAAIRDRARPLRGPLRGDYREFGFSAPLERISQLVYRAEDSVYGLVEHEYPHVFRGVFAGEPRPDPGEVGSWCWMSISQAASSLAERPNSFTPWFALLFERVFPIMALTLSR